MRTTLAALSLAAGIGLACCQSAAAFPVNAAALANSATATSGLEHTQYAERHTRRGIVKCYRELVFGKYSCHLYR